MMKKLLIVGCWFLAGAMAFADAPKVGCTIGLMDHHFYYRSNAFFRERPVSEQMIKDGIDLCLYNGWGKTDAVKSLKQFNAIWLITEHEGECPFKATETAAALKDYVSAGGGLVFCFSPGRYPEAPVDAYWTEVMKTFGAEMLHEEIFNPETEVKVDESRNLFYTSDLVPHPVTAGVPGLWLADRSGGTWGSAAVKYSPEWQVVVTGGKGSLSRPKNRRTNEIEKDKTGFYTHDAPIVAVRQFGKGRIVFIAAHKDSCGWMYGIDKWPNYPERSNYRGKPSDMLALVENALKWAAEPSLPDTSFVKHYKPVEPVVPPYAPQPDFGLRELEKPSYPADLKPANWTLGARGLVGVRSSYSDGTSTVAEYVAAAKAAGLNFLVFCDPLECLTAEKLAKLRADCAANSSDGFYCCPGVEYVDSSDLVWGLWHDKVEFPDPKPFLRDGRYYTMFDGKKILQRNQYGGHQNLYRGVLLNMKHVEDIGNDLINLAYFNAIAPKVFDLDRLVIDNNPYYLKTGHNLHRAATVSYTRVKSAADVAKAARAAVTCGADLKGIRAWANAKGGWGGQAEGEKCHLQAVYGAGVEIRGFDIQRAQGTDVERTAIRATCPAGVSEVTVHDGDRRVLARFDAKGVADFATTFDFLHDRQMALIVTVKGRDGSEAVSTAKWLCYYHAGMFRCGDNSNLLSQNPNVIESLHLDDVMVPAAKAVFTPERHWHVSEGQIWREYYNLPSSIPAVRCWGYYSRINVKGSDNPSETVGLPSSRSVSTLNQPNVVSIFDQYQGDSIMDPTRSEKNGTYAMCSLVRKIGEGRFWRRHHRVYQFVDRHDGWWRAIYKQEAPGYRGGYSMVEGEIDFTEDGELAGPIDLVTIRATNPSKDVDVFARGADVFRAGSYYALHGSDEAWYGFFGLKGSDDLHVATQPVQQGRSAVLQLGAAGRKFKKGDKLVYRFAIGTFVENPRGGSYCEWFARMMDGEGFVHEGATVNGIMELSAKDGKAELTAGSTWFIQNYPARIRGLTDNGCAYVTDGGKIWRPLAFDGADAYAAIPLERHKTWTFLNLYVADDPRLRFTWVPKLPGHEKETVEIFNNTTHDITSKVRNVRTGETFEVTVPAGGMVAALGAGSLAEPVPHRYELVRAGTGDRVRLIEQCWMWGHETGQVDGTNNQWKLDVATTDFPMTAGARSLGIENLNVVRWDRPDRAFRDSLRGLKRVTWPVSGIAHSGSVGYDELADWCFAVADEMPNVTGFDLDDFFMPDGKTQLIVETPEGPRKSCPTRFEYAKLLELKRRMQTYPRPLDLRLVTYDILFKDCVSVEDLKPSLALADTLTYWTWKAENLGTMRENIARLRTLAPGKNIQLGIYLWDFGACREMPLERMEYQLREGLELWRTGAIDGFVFLCSSICNRKLPAVDCARDWLRRHADEVR